MAPASHWPSRSVRPASAVAWVRCWAWRRATSGGWFDLIVQRIAEIMQSLPLLVMALVITASLGAVAGQHHHRHRDPADPERRASDPGERVVVARTQLCRGSPRHRHGAGAHRPGARVPQHPGAVDRAGDGATRLHYPDRGIAVLPRPWRAGAVSIVGPHAVGIGRGVHPVGAVAGDFPRSGHQPGGVRCPICSATRCATSSIRDRAD